MTVRYFNADASGDGSGDSEANGYTDLQTAFTATAGGDTLWLKNGSSRYGSSDTVISWSPAQSNNRSRIEGYGSSIGDGVLFQTSTRFSCASVNADWSYLDVHNVKVAWAYAISLSGGNNVVYRCKAVNDGGYGSAIGLINSTLIECDLRAKMLHININVFYMNRCDAVGNYFESKSTGADSLANSLVPMQSGHRSQCFVNNIIVEKRGAGKGASNGLVYGADQFAVNHTCYGNTIVGVGGSSVVLPEGMPQGGYGPISIYGNIFYSAGAYGIDNQQGTNSTNLGVFAANNAYGAITSSQVNNVDNNFLPITLTANPFVDETDFVLNTTSGGGALLRGLRGVPDMKNPAIAATRLNFPSIGAMQPELGGSASPIISVF
tara:strand:+ start:280 stop:1413 length:1134 start_codon:yes stop_codon:yes gene_type:complete